MDCPQGADDAEGHLIGRHWTLKTCLPVVMSSLKILRVGTCLGSLLSRDPAPSAFSRPGDATPAASGLLVHLLVDDLTKTSPLNFDLCPM